MEPKIDENYPLDYFLGKEVSVTALSLKNTYIFNGLLVSNDDNFIYIDRSSNPEKPMISALQISKIFSIELYDANSFKQEDDLEETMRGLDGLIEFFGDEVDDIPELPGLDDIPDPDPDGELQ